MFHSNVREDQAPYQSAIDFPLTLRVNDSFEEIVRLNPDLVVEQNSNRGNRHHVTNWRRIFGTQCRADFSIAWVGKALWGSNFRLVGHFLSSRWLETLAGRIVDIFRAVEVAF